MNDGSESQVQRDFIDWLTAQGWAIEPAVDYVDVRAAREGRVLLAEVKGKTKASGLDVDTLYGQILRRMQDQDAGISYAIVLPAGLEASARRVPGWVRERLDLAVYLVAEDGGVTQLLGQGGGRVAGVVGW